VAVARILGRGTLGLTLTGGSLMLAGGPDVPRDQKVEPPKVDTKPEAAKAGTMWKENYTVECRR
jgi:hypothetical protein